MNALSQAIQLLQYSTPSDPSNPGPHRVHVRRDAQSAGYQPLRAIRRRYITRSSTLGASHESAAVAGPGHAGAGGIGQPRDVAAEQHPRSLAPGRRPTMSRARSCSPTRAWSKGRAGPAPPPGPSCLAIEPARSARRKESRQSAMRGRKDSGGSVMSGAGGGIGHGAARSAHHRGSDALGPMRLCRRGAVPRHRQPSRRRLDRLRVHVLLRQGHTALPVHASPGGDVDAGGARGHGLPSQRSAGPRRRRVRDQRQGPRRPDCPDHDRPRRMP